jgi:hypothetical protein
LKLRAQPLKPRDHSRARPASDIAAEQSRGAGHVFRLCSPAIPDKRRIIACLERNKRYLDNACDRVFDRDTPAGTSRSGKDTQPARWGR